MDTSKEYIEMCERATEIQKGFTKLEVGDYFVNKGGYVHNFCDICYETFSPVRIGMEWAIKLPRQDQLQEIYCDEYEGRADMWQSFLDFALNGYEADKYKNKPVILFNSGEQLWLVFVMDKRFNKVWDGKEWIKKD